MVDYECIVVGCGFSGISAGYHLQKYRSRSKFVILERREKLGGTWDLFKYPGIRSDSDMVTFGFYWRPWDNRQIISPGAKIISYLNQVVDEIHLRKHIQFKTNVTNASFSSKTNTWTVQMSNPSGEYTITSKFLFFTTGYFQYENPHQPAFPHMEAFKGKIMHPQLWDQDYDYTGQEVIVIGSGATAATLVPSMAQRGAKRVTMLQRSPSYFVSKEDTVTVSEQIMNKVLPKTLATKIAWFKYVTMQHIGYWACQAFPGTLKKALQQRIREEVPPDFDVDTHFNPSYGKCAELMRMT